MVSSRIKQTVKEAQPSFQHYISGLHRAMSIDNYFLRHPFENLFVILCETLTESSVQMTYISDFVAVL